MEQLYTAVGHRDDANAHSVEQRHLVFVSGDKFRSLEARRLAENSQIENNDADSPKFQSTAITEINFVNLDAWMEINFSINITRFMSYLLNNYYYKITFTA